MGPHGPAIFIGDAPGLDFLNSVATPADTTIDWIDDGEGLLNWIEQAQLVPMDVIRKIRQQALPGELDTIAAQARGLREWLRGFVLKHKGHPLALVDPAELQPLNRLLGRDEAYYRVVLEPSGRPAALGVAGRCATGTRRMRYFCRSEKRWRACCATRTSRT